MKSVLEKSQDLEGTFQANLLVYAARSGHVGILQFLVLKCGLCGTVRSPETGALPAHEAAAYGRVEALAWLLAHTKTTLLDRDHYGHTFLHLAAR